MKQATGPRHSWVTVAKSLLLLVVASSVLPAQSSRADSGTVVATVQRLFDAMARRDTVALRDVLLPGARFVAIRGDTVGAVPRVQSDSAFLRAISRADKLLERMWSPVVQVHGPLATVWAPYDFHIDGQRSHCGVDTFTLVRSGATWKISDIAYTVERSGCAPSPLGPPR